MRDVQDTAIYGVQGLGMDGYGLGLGMIGFGCALSDVWRQHFIAFGNIDFVQDNACLEAPGKLVLPAVLLSAAWAPPASDSPFSSQAQQWLSSSLQRQDNNFNCEWAVGQ